jgi:hypothetical protein
MIKDVSTPYGLDKCAAYLSARGFPKNPKLRDELGIEFAGAERCYSLLGKTRVSVDDRVGIIFHYPNEDYATVRWMGTYLNGWGQVVGADRKLECPPTKNPPVYIPAIIDWTSFSGTLYLCESALKAMVLATRGKAAIGSNGTFGMINKNGWAYNFPHEMLDGTDKVAILFDNDYKRNPMVRLAIRRLGNALKDKHPGLRVVHKPLPDPPAGSRYWDASRGKHAGIWGVDDAIAHNGDEWLHQWLSEDDDREIENTEVQQHFDELNEKYCICRNPDVVVDQRTGVLYKKNSFVGLIEAPRVLLSGKGHPLSIAEMWVRSLDRNIVDRIVYAPGAEALTKEYFNTWRDSGVPPVCPASGEDSETWVQPFIDVYKNAVPDDETRILLIQSLAYMVQNRGQKIDKTFLLVGNQVGTGKSLLVKIMGRCVGRSNYASIGVEDLTGGFNSSFVAKEVVALDDVDRVSRAAMAKLRRYVTDETVMVNPKGVQQYEIDNHAVYFFTSNEFVALPMGDNERRVLTVHFDPTVHYPTGTPWWDGFIAWLEGGGYGKIRWWLEQLELGAHFNPNYMPPMTQLKKHIIQSTQSPSETWAADVAADPDLMLGKNLRSAYTPTELWILMTRSGEEPSRKDMIEFGRALGKWFFRANEGKVCRVEEKVSRYWVVRGDGREWDSQQVQADVESYPTLSLE